MEIFLIFLFLPISVAGIILSALKIKNKPLKIAGIVVSSIVTAILLLLAIMVIGFWFDDDSYEDTDAGSQFVAQVENMTDNEDGTFTYDDGEISLTFEEISPEEMENKIAEAAAVVQSSSDEVKNDIAEAPSVLKGESSGNEWTVVSDEEDVPKTVYVNSGNTTVSVTVNNYPKDSGKEYTASVAAALVTDNKPYSENKSENKYRTDSASFYIEEAHCLLYYPAQLSYYSDKDGSYIFRDKKSSASLKVTLSPNNYTSMAEVEGFIKNTENNLVLAYGPNWFTSESKKDGKVTFGYSGFGSEFIVDADLTYPENISGIYEDLTKLIKCRFVGDGIWKSKPSKVGYSKDRSTVYSHKFSREIAAYYSKEYGVILLYPEIFSQINKEDGMIFFTDPVTGAQIIFFADPDYLSLDDWAQAYGFDESFIDGERRVKASFLDGGSYAVMYLTDNENVCAILNYPEEYAWVYEEFESEFTIVASDSEIRNVEMQTVFIEEYGALITMPLQFAETSFYDGVIRYEDAINGMEMTVSFDYLTSEKERKNLFACFNVVADDDNIFVGDSYVRWLSNQGFFYGARGKDMKALMQIDSSNVDRAYESTLPMFSVEFVTEESKEVTKAQTIAQEVTGIAAMSDPPEETSVSNAETASPSDPPDKTSVSNAETSSPSDPPDETTVSGASDASAAKPNKKLLYANADDYAYATADFDYWYSYEKEDIEMYSDDEGWCNDFDCYQVHYDIVVNILKILKYNHYDIDYYGARYISADKSSYEEYAMLYQLIREINSSMYEFYDTEYAYDSDLGRGKPSVLEILCLILAIDKPEYVDYIVGTPPQILAVEEFGVHIPEPEPTTPVNSEPLIDKYRIHPGDTSHDAKYGYDQEMAETIERILAKYSENAIAAYVTGTYNDETVISISGDMMYGHLVEDYGYTTLLVYILSKYSDDPVISAIVSGGRIPAKYSYYYFMEYDDYGTNWGYPYIFDLKRAVYSVLDSSEIDGFELSVDIELCKYIYDKYGEVGLAITKSSYSDYKYPFWINGWESSISKAAYCRDYIVPSVMSVIDKHCTEKYNFSMDCLCADVNTVKFNAGGTSHTGLHITVFERYYEGSKLNLNSMEIYLDLETGALYDGNSILGYIDLDDDY